MEEKRGTWCEKVTCTNKAQIEVSRLLQVIKMVVMRWRERDAPNVGQKPDFGDGLWQSSGEARFFDEGFFKLFQAVMGCDNYD